MNIPLVLSIVEILSFVATVVFIFLGVRKTVNALKKDSREAEVSKEVIGKKYETHSDRNPFLCPFSFHIELPEYTCRRGCTDSSSYRLISRADSLYDRIYCFYPLCFESDAVCRSASSRRLTIS